MSAAERFDHYTEKSVDGCWPWTGTRNKAGYGVIHVEPGVKMLAHRYAAEQAGLTIDGLHVLHTCDNPPCVRPDHLFTGTDADNHEDKARKLRAGKVLTPVQVREIKDILTGEHPPLHLIAADYEVSRKSIQRIKNGHYWKHA